MDFSLPQQQLPAKVNQLTTYDYPNPRALEGLFFYAGSGITTPQQEDNSLGVAFFTMGQGAGRTGPGLEGESVGVTFGAGVLAGYSFFTGTR